MAAALTTHDAHAMRLLDPHDSAAGVASPVSMVRQPSFKRHRTRAQTAVLASAEQELVGPINDIHQGPKWMASLRTPLQPTAAQPAADMSSGRSPTLPPCSAQQLPGKLAGGTGMQEGYAHRSWEARQWLLDSQGLWGSAQVRLLPHLIPGLISGRIQTASANTRHQGAAGSFFVKLQMHMNPISPRQSHCFLMSS